MLSVINSINRRSWKGILIQLFLLVPLVGLVDPWVAAQDTGSDDSLPFVRVKWKQDFEGLMHREFLVKDARIVEVSEYSGVVMDSRGYVAVYIPDPLKLSSPQGAFTVSAGSEVDLEAELLGVDQRLSVAFLKAEGAGQRQAVFGREISGEEFKVLVWNGSQWDEKQYRAVKLSGNQFGPVLTIKALAGAEDGSGWVPFKRTTTGKSSFILDNRDRLVGLGVSSKFIGSNRKTLEFKVFPIDTVRESLKQLRRQKGGLLESGWIGVYIDSGDSGVRVTQVVPESPAREVGIRAGDTIVAIDKQPLMQVEDFIQAVKWRGPKRGVDLTVLREGSRREYRVVLGSSPVYKKPIYEWALDIPPILKGPGQLARDVRFRPVPSARHRNIGIQVEKITSQLAEYFKSPTGSGLLVEAVENDSLASQVGLKAGDVLIMIDNRVLNSSSDLLRIMDAFQEPVELSYVRDGKVVKQRILFR